MAAMMLSAAAKEASESDVENYKRSSLYTIILKSDKQNKYFEEETKKGENADALASLAKSFVKKDVDSLDNDVSIFELPAIVFTTIDIPNQFNDHNLDIRVLDFDALRAGVTKEDLEKYGVKKKGGFGKFAKGLGKSLVGMSTEGDDINGEFDEYAPAVLGKFFATNHTPELLMAKWYDYNPERDEHWSMAVVEDRGLYNFTPEDIQMAANDPALRDKIAQTGFDMVGDTYVMAVNLRFRSYQAVVAEAAAMAKAAGSMFGGIGQLAAQAASTGASMAAGDGYTVQAVTNLYKLKMNPDVETQFAEQVYAKNGSLEDLINAGIIELEYLGSEKSSSNIRQSLMSKRSMKDLVKRATARAIDESIVKLQNNHSEFRTAFPIIGGDNEGTIYARIGTKEGLNEKDEYEILEKQEDKNGRVFYKSVGSAKAIKGKIMNNANGAAEEVADNEKASDADREAVERSYTEFKGKKGDYKGYYLRLKKKK